MEITKKILKELNIDKGQVLEQYGKEVLSWNEKVNLTRITDLEEFDEKHFADSLLITGLVEFQRAKTVVDVGTGAGFPGIPLAILYPEKEFVLIDSLRKRLNIIDEITKAMGIKNVTTLHGRVEDIGQNEKYRESFDLCVSRAVARLSVLSEYCLPLVKKGGTFIAYKGEKGIEEALEGSQALKILGGKLHRTIMGKDLFPCSGFSLNHQLLIIEKKEKTPKKYPRKPGVPGKNAIK